ncbi:MAG: DUF2000 domain-containing protein [Erysipelotrichaceae bacterium]|nr:DUF2000 domain-containing protein [Erysipelotrichaceae bacterium]
MNEERKCVMVVDENLPLGIIANTAAILGNTLGSHYPCAVGKDVSDKTGNLHLGIIEIPIPILKGNKEILNDLRKKLYQEEYQDIIVADFSDVAQSCKTYDEYIDKISKIDSKDITYFGIAIYGNKKQINKLTGSIGLLR